MEWTRRRFEAHGLTQHPPLAHLAAVQATFAGSVVLCLDVSGSMHGARLAQAVNGCHRFVDEALAAGYAVGGVLWHHAVAASTAGVDRAGAEAGRLFASAVATGGNDIVPTLLHCKSMLADAVGDRVVAIFGDGDLGDARAASAEASRLLALGIRVITCGLGDASAEQLGTISSVVADRRVASADDIASAIAGMASSLKRPS